jgi:F-type H+-transporting ATPase subunit delta
MRVEVEAALPVEPPLLAEIVAGLKRAFGAEPVVTTRVNPDLLAGFVVRIGDKVYDASARTGIERARQSMVARAIETIQSKPGQFFTTN